MLTENKFSKYLLYAIGEIILVVIGILIALSLNNWNEEKKTIAEEKVLLSSLLEDFKNNKLTIENQIYWYNYFIPFYESKLHYMGTNANELNQGMKDTLISKVFMNPIFSIGTLNSITNSDQSELIQNTELKRMLNAYTSGIDLNLKRLEEIDELRTKQLEPLIESRVSLLERTINKHKYADLLPNALTSDYNALLNDVKFQNTLLKMLELINRYISDTNNFLEKTDTIVELLQTELDIPLIWDVLLKSGKTIDQVIEIARQQDKNDRLYDISETYINDLGYRFLNTDDKYNVALKLFKLNVELYPNSWNTYESYGECLLKVGDTISAIKAYEKSLEFNPESENAKKVLLVIK